MEQVPEIFVNRQRLSRDSTAIFQTFCKRSVILSDQQHILVCKPPFFEKAPSSNETSFYRNRQNRSDLLQDLLEKGHFAFGRKLNLSKVLR